MEPGGWIVIADSHGRDAPSHDPRAAGPFDEEESARAFAIQANHAGGDDVVAWVARLYHPSDLTGLLIDNR